MKQQDSASGAIVIRKFNKPHNAAEWLELVMNAIFFLCGILAIGCVALITVYMVISGLPAIGQIGIVDFLFGQEWASTAAEPKFALASSLRLELLPLEDEETSLAFAFTPAPKDNVVSASSPKDICEVDEPENADMVTLSC